LSDDEAEVMMGCVDDPPTTFAPEYELWVPRREPWLLPVRNAKQYDRDREVSYDEMKPR
jgi:hypothetical protein